LKEQERSLVEPQAEVKVPDYLSLGTFDTVKQILESDTLKNRESQVFDFGTVSKSLYVIQYQIADRYSRFKQWDRECELRDSLFSRTEKDKVEVE
jgi:hypothetical protein